VHSLYAVSAKGRIQLNAIGVWQAEGIRHKHHLIELGKECFSEYRCLQIPVITE
jgi:hypothetical protein